MSCCGPADTACLFSITEITIHCENLVSATKKLLYLSSIAYIYYVSNTSAKWAARICSVADAALCHPQRKSKLLIFEFFIPDFFFSP